MRNLFKKAASRFSAFTAGLLLTTSFAFSQDTATTPLPANNNTPGEKIEVRAHADQKASIKPDTLPQLPSRPLKPIVANLQTAALQASKTLVTDPNVLQTLPTTLTLTHSDSSVTTTLSRVTQQRALSSSVVTLDSAVLKQDFTRFSTNYSHYDDAARVYQSYLEDLVGGNGFAIPNVSNIRVTTDLDVSPSPEYDPRDQKLHAALQGREKIPYIFVLNFEDFQFNTTLPTSNVLFDKNRVSLLQFVNAQDFYKRSKENVFKWNPGFKFYMNGTPLGFSIDSPLAQKFANKHNSHFREAKHRGQNLKGFVQQYGQDPHTYAIIKGIFDQDKDVIPVIGPGTYMAGSHNETRTFLDDQIPMAQKSALFSEMALYGRHWFGQHGFSNMWKIFYNNPDLLSKPLSKTYEKNPWLQKSLPYSAVLRHSTKYLGVTQQDAERASSAEIVRNIFTRDGPSFDVGGNLRIKGTQWTQKIGYNSVYNIYPNIQPPPPKTKIEIGAFANRDALGFQALPGRNGGASLWFNWQGISGTRTTTQPSGVKETIEVRLGTSSSGINFAQSTFDPAGAHNISIRDVVNPDNVFGDVTVNGVPTNAADALNAPLSLSTDICVDAQHDGFFAGGLYEKTNKNNREFGIKTGYMQGYSNEYYRAGLDGDFKTGNLKIGASAHVGRINIKTQVKNPEALEITSTENLDLDGNVSWKEIIEEPDSILVEITEIDWDTIPGGFTVDSSKIIRIEPIYEVGDSLKIDCEQVRFDSSYTEWRTRLRDTGRDTLIVVCIPEHGLCPEGDSTCFERIEDVYVTERYLKTLVFSEMREVCDTTPDQYQIYLGNDTILLGWRRDTTHYPERIVPVINENGDTARVVVGEVMVANTDADDNQIYTVREEQRSQGTNGFINRNSLVAIKPRDTYEYLGDNLQFWMLGVNASYNLGSIGLPNVTASGHFIVRETDGVNGRFGGNLLVQSDISGVRQDPGRIVNQDAANDRVIMNADGQIIGVQDGLGAGAIVRPDPVSISVMEQKLYAYETSIRKSTNVTTDWALAATWLMDQKTSFGVSYNNRETDFRSEVTSRFGDKLSTQVIKRKVTEQNIGGHFNRRFNRVSVGASVRTGRPKYSTGQKSSWRTSYQVSASINLN